MIYIPGELGIRLEDIITITPRAPRTSPGGREPRKSRRWYKPV
jgi:Xaa-Pro aminopeptidase